MRAGSCEAGRAQLVILKHHARKGVGIYTYDFKHANIFNFKPETLTLTLITVIGITIRADVAVLYRILADAVVVIHLAFVVFALLGGFLVLKWKKAVWGHVPAVLWAIWVECQGWTCPLTPLENWLRQQSGEAWYTEGFIDHYLVPILYPPGLTREWQFALGTIVLLLNLTIYMWIWSRTPPIKT